MSIPKKTKFRAIIKLEEAIDGMTEVGFTFQETKEIVRDMTRPLKQRKEEPIKLNLGG